MIYKFNLNRKDGRLFFGKLGLRSDEPDHFAVIDAESYERRHLDRLASLITHDAVEHGKRHATASAVTFVDEYRALGATLLMRPGIEIKNDLRILLEEQHAKNIINRVQSPYRKGVELPFTYEEFKDIFFELEFRVLEFEYKTIYSHLVYGYWNSLNIHGSSAEAENVFYNLEYMLRDELHRIMMTMYDHEDNCCHMTYDTEAVTLNYHYSTNYER